MLAPGALNLITDVAGVRVGNAEDRQAWTGVSLLLPEGPAVAAVDVRGGAPGTRETEALEATCLVDHVHAIVLSGGSAFGLDAAGAVAALLGARGIGFAIREARVPIVPAAILFDLLNGGDKAWGEDPPYRELARAALAAAEGPGGGGSFALGNSGAGFGAKAGALKGGLGSVSTVASDGLQVGALVAVNSWGSAVMPGSGAFWAWPFEQQGEFGGRAPPRAGVPLDPALPAAEPGANTTIGIVATNAVLDKAEARRVAIMAQDGLSRAIRPAHAPFDGDTLFVLATGRHRLAEPRPFALARLGTLAADCVARAVARGVFAADSLGPSPSWRDSYGGGLASR
ncbi:MAG: P1 family peptidase [Alphaproteobacteria bacterium]|nr:P1 family peptidase [Alphaproteobacteria bacterium]